MLGYAASLLLTIAFFTGAVVFIFSKKRETLGLKIIFGTFFIYLTLGLSIRMMINKNKPTYKIVKTEVENLDVETLLRNFLPNGNKVIFTNTGITSKKIKEIQYDKIYYNIYGNPQEVEYIININEFIDLLLKLEEKQNEKMEVEDE